MPAIVRFIIPFGLAALVTFGLFWLMQSLIGLVVLDHAGMERLGYFLEVFHSLRRELPNA